MLLHFPSSVNSSRGFPSQVKSCSKVLNGNKIENIQMSIAYPVIKVSVTAVAALEDHQVSVRSVWQTGNLLFRSQECGADLQLKIENWARAVDSKGRSYILWATDHPKAAGLVIQPLDSHYCFEILPVEP